MNSWQAYGGVLVFRCPKGHEEQVPPERYPEALTHACLTKDCDLTANLRVVKGVK